MPDQAEPAYQTLNVPGVAENIDQVIGRHGTVGRLLAINRGSGWAERGLPAGGVGT